MLRKLSLALAGTILFSGAALAAPTTSPFPLSINESVPYQAEQAPATSTVPGITQSSAFPTSVSEVGPNYPATAVDDTAGRAAPLGAYLPGAGIREVLTPTSVSEVGPNYPSVVSEHGSAPSSATASSETPAIR